MGGNIICSMYRSLLEMYPLPLNTFEFCYQILLMEAYDQTLSMARFCLWMKSTQALTFENK